MAHLDIQGFACTHTRARTYTHTVTTVYLDSSLLFCPQPLLLYSIIPADGKTIIIPRVSRKAQTVARAGRRGRGGGKREWAQVTVHFHRGQAETVQLCSSWWKVKCVFSLFARLYNVVWVSVLSFYQTPGVSYFRRHQRPTQFPSLNNILYNYCIKWEADGGENVINSFLNCCVISELLQTVWALTLGHDG